MPSDDLLQADRSQTDRSQADRSQADLLRAALANVPHGLCMYDSAKRLILCNPAYAAMYRLPTRLTKRGTPLDDILDHRRTTGNAPADFETYFDVVPIAHNSGRHAGTRIKLEDGRTIQITHNPMPDGGYVAVHEDVSQHIDVENRLRYLAGHDQLTGLCNRHAFGERFAASLAKAPPGVEIAVHCLDLDRFKAVNDALGHHVGDMLLRRVAKRITGCASPHEVIGRLGGDEFIVLQPDVGGEAGARSLAKRVIETIARPFRLNGHRVSVGVSIGIAIYPEHGSTCDSLLKNADRVLYEAKASGGNALHVFGAQQAARHRLRAEPVRACTA